MSVIAASTPRVTITVVLYNSADVIKDCLGSVSLPLSRGTAKLIAVNNCSPDEGISIAKETVPNGSFLEAAENRGFAAGCNLAWRQVDTDYWLLLNPDARFAADGGLEALIDWMDRHPSVGIVCPEILDTEGRSIHPARRFPSILRQLIDLSRIYKLLSRRMQRRLFLSSFADRQETLDADWVPATVILVRTRAAEEAGPMSEEFFMYGEDMEWCLRFKKKGWQIAYHPEVVAIHGDSTSSVKTWGEAEKEERMLQGYYRAVRMMRGSAYAKSLSLINYAIGMMRSINPKHSGEQRDGLRKAARSHKSAGSI